MAKYLKLFENHLQYESFTQTEEFIKPNVSHCIAENEVHYNPYIQYEKIDLGLPSGNLWSSCNVGSKYPWENGLYFAWGETQGYTAEQIVGDALPHKDFSKEDYTGPTTQLSTLTPDLDAATVNMGAEWVTPNVNDCDELFNNVIVNPVIIEGVTALKLTSKINGKSIILPSCGNYDNGEKYNENYIELYTSNASWMASNNEWYNASTVIGINNERSGEITLGRSELWNLRAGTTGTNVRGIIKGS